MFLHLKQKEGRIPTLGYLGLSGKDTAWLLLTLLNPSVNSPAVLVSVMPL